MKKYLILIILLMPLVSAQLPETPLDELQQSTADTIIVSKVISDPKIILPGEEVRLEIRIENNANEDLENILVKLDLTSEDLPFAPLNSITETTIKNLEEDESETVLFKLKTLPNAESRIYKIPFFVLYQQKVINNIISLTVNSQPILNVNLEESKEVLIKDTVKEITLKFINEGLTDVKFLKVTLLSSDSYEILSPNEIYIGDLDSDDFETATFKLNLKKTSIKLPILLEYKDQFNKKFAEQKLIPLKVYTKEQAQELNLISSFKIMPILITIILFIILLFLYKKLKKQ